MAPALASPPGSGRPVVLEHQTLELLGCGDRVRLREHAVEGAVDDGA